MSMDTQHVKLKSPRRASGQGVKAKYIRDYSKIFQCDKCGKMYSTGAGLNKHMRCHVKNAIEKSTEETRSLKSDETLEKDNNAEEPSDTSDDLLDPDYVDNGCRRRTRAQNTSRGKRRLKRPTNGNLAEFKVRVPKDPYLEGDDGYKTVYRCDFCDKDFRSGSRLMVHRRIHTDERPFECKVCHRCFKQKVTLQDHEATHLSYKPHKCGKCGTAFKQLRILQHHMTLPICEKKMKKNNEDLQRGVIVEGVEEDGEKTQSIDRCLDESKDGVPKDSSLKETEEFEKKFCCDFCDKAFKCGSQLKRHQRIHTNERPFECKICQRGFKQKVTLQDHEKTHLSDKPHKCEKCGTGFKQLRILRQHMRLPICDKKMKKNNKDLQRKDIGEAVEEDVQKAQSIDNSLDEFKVRVPRDSTLTESEEFEIVYRCDFCGKDFKSGCLLKRHRRIHTNERPFECKVCQRCFKQKVTLHYHEATHLSDKPHKCEKCGACFKQRRILRQHMKLPICEKKMKKNKDLQREVIADEVEEDIEQTSSIDECFDDLEDGFPNDSTITESEEVETLHCCDICDKAFRHGSLLKRHQRIHTDERPFQCKICQRRFKQKVTLQDHEKTHLSDKPHKCEKCGTCFKQLRVLRQHMRLPICEKKMIQNNRDLQRKIIVEDKEDVKQTQSIDGHLDKSKDIIPEETMLLCDICGKAFQHGSLLKRHRRVHTDERPFECKICQRRFKQKVTLQAHETTHLSNKPHKCEKCGTAFKQLRILQQHMRLPICEKKRKKNEELIIKTKVQEDENEKQLVPPDTQHQAAATIEQVMQENNDREIGAETETSENIRDNSCHREKVHVVAENEGTGPSQRDIDLEMEVETIADDVGTGSGQREHAQSFACENCGKVFKAKKNLLQHKKTHTQERPFACGVCFKEFKMKSTLVQHLDIHTEGKPHSCQTCEKSFKTKKCLQIHIGRNICSGVQPFACENCSKTFTYRKYLEKHSCGGNSPKIFECEECDRTFTRRNLFIEHKRTHTGERPLECEECGKKFAKRDLLRRHRLTHKEKKVVNKECGMGFVQKSTLQTHIAMHSEDKQHVCKVCSRAFKVASSLRNHLKTMHSEKTQMEEAKPGHICSKCGKHFTHLQWMLKHLCEASGIKRFSCSTCGKQFKKKQQLEVHSRVHTGARPYACKQCKKSFTQPNTLKDHMVTHTREKNYKCNYCDSVFTRKNSLRKHKLIIHQGVEPFMCNKCGLTFKYKKSCDAHIQGCEVVLAPVDCVQTETENTAMDVTVNDDKALSASDLEQQVLDNILGNIERAMNGRGIVIGPDVQYEIIVGQNANEVAVQLSGDM